MPEFENTGGPEDSGEGREEIRNTVDSDPRMIEIKEESAERKEKLEDIRANKRVLTEEFKRKPGESDEELGERRARIMEERRNMKNSI